MNMAKRLKSSAIIGAILWSMVEISGALIAEELFNADLYLAGTNREQLIFRQKNSIVKKKDITILTHTYTHVNGALAAKACRIQSHYALLSQ
jgi:hypothetical protein